ncbi:phosphoglycerate kinase [Nematocida sp. AWRm80]|nr:phosphoglycerate kinase [Nematocida sp. AWRm80]
MKVWTHEVYAGKKTLVDVCLENKRVFLRVDYNVPIGTDNKNNVYVCDSTKITRSISTIQFLLNQKVKSIVIGTHLGRPTPDEDPIDSPTSGGILPIIEQLNTELNKAGIQINFKYVPMTEKDQLNYPWVVVQNLRTLKVEKDGKDKKSKRLFDEFIKNNCDIEVNDAFGVLHRNDYSVVGLPLEKIPGLLVDSELQGLSILLGKTKPQNEHSPLHNITHKQIEMFLEDGKSEKGFKLNNTKPIDLLIIGGCKLQDKIQLVKNLLQVASNIFLGGLLGTVFLEKPISESTLEIVETAIQEGVTIFLPQDYILESLDICAAEDITEITRDSIRDIGPQTESLLKKLIKGSKRIFWNGTLGQAEKKEFAHGTETALETILKQRIAISEAQETSMICAGGGDTAGYIYMHQYDSAFDYVFTGGGATLEALEGKILPGVQAMPDRI